MPLQRPSSRQPLAKRTEGIWSSLKSPPPPQCTQKRLDNDFSTHQTIEQYPAKVIGTLHGDLYLQATANQIMTTGECPLNIRDKRGDTELHRVFMEANNDHELMGKRLYAMILAGGNPNIPNRNGLTVMMLASSESSIVNAYIKAAMDRAILINSHAEQPLTERLGVIDGDLQTIPNQSKLRQFIQEGGNPYKNDANGKNAMDIVSEYPPFDRIFLIGQLQTMFQLVHSRPLPDQEKNVSEELQNISAFNTKNYSRFMSGIHPEQQEQILEDMKENSTEFIEQHDERKLKFFIHCLEHQLPKVIGSFSDFKKLLSKLTSENDRTLVYQAMKYQLDTFADYTNSAELNDLLSEQQIQFIETIHSKGEGRATFIKEQKEIELDLKNNCIQLIEKIDALRINCVAPDVKMDEFLREKYNLLAAPTDIPTITRTQHDLETTYNALKNDKIVPEIIKIINKFNTTTNVLTQNEDRKKARSIETALISVPVINRHEIMNEAANTPEITAVQKALASHRSLFRKGSEFNPDHTINESTAAHSFKLIKAKYREQQKKHNDLIISSDSTIRNEETSSTRVGPGGKKQCYKTIY